MKINSISSAIYTTGRPGFKSTAVPYPEYKDAYIIERLPLDERISNFVSRISDLFTPSVTKEAKEIKSEINSIFEDDETNPKEQLLSVLV